MKTLKVSTESELVAALQSAFATSTPAVVAGGGTDSLPGFDGLVIDVQTRGVDVNDEGCGVHDLVVCAAVTVTLAAGEPWDEFVASAVEHEWVGVEALSGLPGNVGNVVAANQVQLGQSIADTVASVRTWDRATDSQRTFAMVDCEFEPGSSRFSRELLPDGTPRYVILAAAFLLKQGETTPRVIDPALAKALGIQLGDRALLSRVRELILSQGK